MIQLAVRGLDELTSEVCSQVGEGPFALIMTLHRAASLDELERFSGALARTRCDRVYFRGHGRQRLEYLVDGEDALLMEDAEYQQRYGREVLLTVETDDAVEDCLNEMMACAATGTLVIIADVVR